MAELESEHEKKNKRIAMLSTAGITAVVLLAMLLIVAWRAPNPPLPEYGIELNFGMDTQGSGKVQPREPVGVQKAQEEQPQEQKPVEAKEAMAEEITPTESKPVEQQIISKVESPVAVKEEKKEEVKPTQKPKEKVVEEKKTEAKTEPKPEAPKAVWKANEGKEGKQGSHGDDVNKAGDKGSPQGSLDKDALYGKAGGGGGGAPGLNLAGWNWDYIPEPEIPNNENGKIVFRIRVDNNGELIGYEVIEKSVSAAAEQACKRSIERLTFTKEPGAVVPSTSTGTITFIIRSN